MSRLGKLPIELKEGIQVKLDGGFVIVKGPKGELREKLHPKVKVEVNDKEVKVSVNNPEEKNEKSLWGLLDFKISLQINLASSFSLSAV